MGDQKRATDHYKWADRYMRYGDTQKAAAHMKRALHYAPKSKSRFGTPGSTPDTGAGPAPMNVPREDKDTDLIFVLAPLNPEAANRIRSSIRQSIREGKKVEVYMQAFTENEPDSPITAPNLLPMNFNQYSSDNPGVLVDIINEFRDHAEVSFYIFPTQTTKNSHFWSRAAKQKMVDMLSGKKEKVDPWILMAIVTWLLKDGDIMNGDGKKGNSPGTLRKRFEDLHGTNGDIDALLHKFKKLSEPQADPKKPPTHATDAILPIFDPFCVHCAAYKSSGSVPFSGVPGSGNLNAAPVSVYMNDDFTNDEVVEYFKAIQIKQNPEILSTMSDEHKRAIDSRIDGRIRFDVNSKTMEEKNKIMTDSNHAAMHRPRFKKATGKTDGCYNCYRVGWDSGNAASHAKLDGVDYMESLLASVCGELSGVKRIVNRVLFIQDYYDYDNRFGVWYALLAIGAAIFELYSVSRPVADKTLMKQMRRMAHPFAFDGGFPNLQSPLGKDAKEEWGQYPPAGPVYTKSKFDGIVTAMQSQTDPASLFDKYKQAIYADHSRESLEDSKKIALTWYVFLCYMMRKGLIANTQMQMSVVNGGYTNHHRFNPAMHTIQEDWVSDADLEASSESQRLYASFGVNMPVIVPWNTTHIDTILGELKLNDLPRAKKDDKQVASGFGYSRQRF
jgi:hypothetical protein